MTTREESRESVRRMASSCPSRNAEWPKCFPRNARRSREAKEERAQDSASESALYCAEIGLVVAAVGVGVGVADAEDDTEGAMAGAEEVEAAGEEDRKVGVEMEPR